MINTIVYITVLTLVYCMGLIGVGAFISAELEDTNKYLKLLMWIFWPITAFIGFILIIVYLCDEIFEDIWD